MSSPLPVLHVTAGQVYGLPLLFEQKKGVPVDLTGATVHLAAKTSFDAVDTVFTIEQATHTDAAAGETTLPFDLSASDATWFTDGIRFVGTIWIVDAQDQVIPWGNVNIDIEQSAIPRVT